MAKLAGRYLKVLIDDSAGTPRDVSSDIESIDVPDEYGELDMTGFGEGGENSIPGMPSFPVEITANYNPAATTGIYTVVKGILGSYTSKTLTVQVGQNAAATTGDPEFEGEFWAQKMNVSATPKGKVSLTISLRPMGSTAPAWGTVA
jgi:hypothetical protein